MHVLLNHFARVQIKRLPGIGWKRKNTVDGDER